MAAPNAPFPLAQQVKQGSNIVVTIVLRGVGAGPTFTDGGTTYNSGDPTATFTLTIPATSSEATNGTASITNNAAYDLCSLVERMWREGDFTVT